MSKTLDFEHLVGLCRRAHQETQRSMARAVDRYLVTRNWLFGWYIVEYEQSGADRAEYGAALIKRLADKLTIRGCSSRSLALSCKFYRCYSEILQTPSAQSRTLPPDERLDAGRPTFGSPVVRDGLQQESFFRVVRNGKTLELVVLVGLLENLSERTVRDWSGVFPNDMAHGLRVAQINGSGGSAAAGIRHGDVITHINDDNLDDVGDFCRAIGAAGNGGDYRFRILRNATVLAPRVVLCKSEEGVVTMAVSAGSNELERERLCRQSERARSK